MAPFLYFYCTYLNFDQLLAFKSLGLFDVCSYIVCGSQKNYDRFKNGD